MENFPLVKLVEYFEDKSSLVTDILAERIKMRKMASGTVGDRSVSMIGGTGVDRSVSMIGGIVGDRSVSMMSDTGGEASLAMVNATPTNRNNVSMPTVTVTDNDDLFDDWDDDEDFINSLDCNDNNEVRFVDRFDDGDAYRLTVEGGNYGVV